VAVAKNLRRRRWAVGAAQQRCWVMERQAKRDGQKALAIDFIVEHRELCDLLARKLGEFGEVLENAKELRVQIVRLLVKLRRALQEYAKRHGLDARRFTARVMLRLNLTRFVGNFFVLNSLVRHARKLEWLYQTLDFERVERCDELEKYLRHLRLRDENDVAAELRDHMRALAVHYANITDRQEAFRFLRQLAEQFEQV